MTPKPGTMGRAQAGEPPDPAEWGRRVRRSACVSTAAIGIVLDVAVILWALSGYGWAATICGAAAVYQMWRLGRMFLRKTGPGDRLLAAIGQVPHDTPMLTPDGSALLTTWWLPRRGWAVARASIADGGLSPVVYVPQPVTGRVRRKPPPGPDATMVDALIGELRTATPRAQ